MDFIKNINWKVRFMNRAWVVAFIAAIFVLIGAVCNLFGFQIDLTNVQDNIVKIVYAVFGVIAVIGVGIDPTTEGLYDSERAMEYDTPGGYIVEDEIEESE
jgi:phi LC3 family holin